jgi:serine phosphatase RsbU (regulator of sigma subunit)
MPQTQIITFSAGDLFVAVTDGFTDQPGGQGERPVSLGHRRLASWVGELAGHSASDSLRSLKARFQDWQGKQVRRDDVTVITFTL